MSSSISSWSEMLMFSSLPWFFLPLPPFLLMFLINYLNNEKTIPVFPSELLVFENVFIVIVSDFVKVIHVELSDKWWEISMSKVDRQNLFLKFLDIDNDEICALVVPRYHILIDIILNRNRYTSSIW